MVTGLANNSLERIENLYHFAADKSEINFVAKQFYKS